MIRSVLAVDDQTSTRVLTVPNAITVVRLACIPVFLWLLFARDNRAAAGWLLGALGATDWVDGFIARRFDQVSVLGKVLDPFADRALFIICGGAIIIDGSIPIWYALAIVAREAIIGAVLVALTFSGMKRFDVTWVGKTATFLNMFAFPLFLAQHSTLGWHRGGGIAAWCFAVPGLVLSYWSAITYVPTMRHALAEGRKERIT
ncbi:MAG: CDP-alcohol phosphatidyltransferase family protein [Acidimicrobiia bacterium]